MGAWVFSRSLQYQQNMVVALKRFTEFGAARGSMHFSDQKLLATSTDRKVGCKRYLISRFPLRGKQEFMSSRDVEIFIFYRDVCVERKDRNVSARHKLLFPSQWETTFLSYITTPQRQQTNQTAITGPVSIAAHCSALLPSHIPDGDVILNVYITPR